MQEPEFWHPNGARLAYSQAPTKLLQDVVYRPESFTAGPQPGTDLDFRRRYAAILLKERGQ